ncbi:COMM domain-containing protein 10-like [Maniola jurtina]|uniref:COMM domain-containing protein 10-like n=1 Tax=Maniola jurtina TaxID=191418 RepID=UPI001E68AE71|nr:COMM domain-containing protein 10-like [Maniola jurtina]
MDCAWLKTSSSLKRGIEVVNHLDESRFEQFLRRIVTKLKLYDSEIFTEEERRKLEKIFQLNEEQLLLAIKSILYIFKRLFKFIFMPNNLKTDLLNIGFNNEKTNFLIKVWSTETSVVLNEMGSSSNEKYEDDPILHWKLNAELSSEYQKKCKIPKAYISFIGKNDETEIEMTRQDLNSIFLQIEAIQTELDILL